MTIRDAAPGDKAEWLTLWQAYLHFYGLTLAPDVTETTWARLMDPASPLKMRVADQGAGLCGFAIHLPHLSTWVTGEDCYLQDLFVAPGSRGQGLGRALIDDLVALAPSRGWARLWWLTEEGNAPARRLYDSIAPCDGHVRYRRAL